MAYVLGTANKDVTVRTIMVVFPNSNIELPNNHSITKGNLGSYLVTLSSAGPDGLYVQLLNST
jgi:hypothetical protein